MTATASYRLARIAGGFRLSLSVHIRKTPCHREHGAIVSCLVPKARVELAWISPNDFESFASTIPPFGQTPYRLAF